MKKYKKLIYEERVTIKVCLWQNNEYLQIVSKMRRSQSTVSREIKREQ